MICACIAACSINTLLCKSCFMVFKGTVSRGDKDELCYFLNVLLIIYVKDETVLHLLTKVRHSEFLRQHFYLVNMLLKFTLTSSVLLVLMSCICFFPEASLEKNCHMNLLPSRFSVFKPRASNSSYLNSVKKRFTTLVINA